MLKGIKPSLPLSTSYLFVIPNSHFFKQWELYYQTAELSADWRIAFNSAIAGELGGLETLILMLGKGEKLLRNHDEWSETLPNENRHTLHDIDQSLLPYWMKQISSMAPPITQYHVYPNLQSQLRLRLLWTCRLILIQAMLQTIQYLEEHIEDELLLSTWYQQRTELEPDMVRVIGDMLLSCISTLICPDFTQSAMNSLSEIPSWKGYHMFWPLCTSHHCLHQTVLRTTTCGDLPTLSENLISILLEQMGFEKAAALMLLHTIGDPRPQLWMLDS